MKKFISLLAIAIISLPLAAKKQPQWIIQKPVEQGYYIGVGQASCLSPGYEAKAKEAALADLISEIKIVIEQKSLFERLDSNGQYSEKFASDIRSSSKAWLEGYELVDSYNDGRNYWVLYRLDKAKYQALREQKSKEAAQNALDLYNKGNKAIADGNLLSASRLYAQGILTIEPFADMRLEVVSRGNTLNIAAELQYSLLYIFQQFAISTTPRKLEIVPFSAQATELLIRITDGSHDIVGLPITAKMDTGEANVTVSGTTDLTGHTRISISDVSAKPSLRNLIITPVVELDTLFSTPLIKSIVGNSVNSIRPISVPVKIKDKELKAICIAANNASLKMTDRLAAYINSTYFDTTNSEEEADIKFIVSYSCRPGALIPGDMYQMREYFSSVSVKAIRLSTQSTIATVAIKDYRSLSPAKTTPAKAMADAQRTLLGKVEKSLNSQLLAAQLNPRTAQSTSVDDKVVDSGDFFNEDYQ